MARRRVAHHQPDRDRRQRDKDDDGAECRPASRCPAPAQASGVVAARLPSRPIDNTTAVSVEKRSGGNQREIITMLPISITPQPAPISTRPVRQHRPMAPA